MAPRVTHVGEEAGEAEKKVICSYLSECTPLLLVMMLEDLVLQPQLIQPVVLERYMPTPSIPRPIRSHTTTSPSPSARVPTKSFFPYVDACSTKMIAGAEDTAEPRMYTLLPVF